MKKHLLPVLMGTLLLLGCNSQPATSEPSQDKMKTEKQTSERAERNTEPYSQPESDRIAQESESINGVYQYAGGDAKSEIVVMGSTWTGSFSFVSGFGTEYDAGNAEYQSGIVRGNDLYDESGYVKIGYIQGRSLTTTVGGQYLTLRKQ